MLDVLDAAAVRRWSAAALVAVEDRRAELDSLNVYPVPDADTGTNLVVTLRAADAAIAEALANPPTTGHAIGVGTALRALARGAVVGAAGNSGVILSQVLRGLADHAHDLDQSAPDGHAVHDGTALRTGLGVAAELAVAAVEVPVEGTILSVARAAADDLPIDAPLGEVVSAAVRNAEKALLRTPEQLPELARAGVVDAGGLGLVLLLAALAEVVHGTPTTVTVTRPARSDEVLRAARETGSDAFAYEVQFLLDADEPTIPRLRAELAALGDSVVLVGTGDGTWNVHVHVNDVGAAIEAGLDHGRPHRITVVRFADQIAASAASGPRAATGSEVIAVAPGAGLGYLFAGEGIRVVEDAVAVAVAAELRALAAETGTDAVVLLSSGPDGKAAAETAAVDVRTDGIRVSVVPTRSPVQALAAIAVHDAGRRFDDDVVAMAEAAAATRFAEVTVATGEALTSVGICQAGDVLGLIDADVVHIGHGTVSVALALVDRLLGIGAEMMTVLLAADAPANLGPVLTDHVRERSPLTDVIVYAAGTSDAPVIIGVE